MLVYDVVFAACENRNAYQRNKQSSILKPEPYWILVSSVPANLPCEETAGMDRRVRS